MSLIALIYLAAIAVGFASTYTCNTYPLFPYGEDRGDTVISDGDEGNVLVELGSPFKFYGYYYNSVRVYINGLISFGEDSEINDFEGLLLVYTNVPAASVFYSAVTLDSDDIGRIFYRKVNLAEESDLVEQITKDTEIYGKSIIPELIFIVTWMDVRGPDDPNKRNTFQLALVVEGNTTIICHNYGKLTWVEAWGLTFQYTNGHGATAVYTELGYLGYPDHSNVGLPGRILKRADPRDLGRIRIPSITCSACTVDMNTGEVANYYGHQNISVNLSNRKFLMSRLYEPDEGEDPNQCRFLLKIVTDINGKMDWLSFAIGVHPKNPHKYKRDFVFERQRVDQVLVRGHGMKPTVVTSQFTEELEGENGEEFVVKLNTSNDGWEIYSHDCHYKLTHYPSDEHDQIKLSFDLNHGIHTIGLCEYLDGLTTCDESRERGNITAIIESCSCPRNNKTCNKALKTL